MKKVSERLELDLAEYERLSTVVESVEKVLREDSILSPSILGEFLLNAKDRLAELGHELGFDGHQEDRKKDAYNLVLGAISVKLERESLLSASESAQYGSFLEKPFFTHDDFEELNEFYGSTYDRLSEAGKAELSFRVWEGIRQGEYQFTDLPENVKDKEMERLFGLISDPERMTENLQQIPEKDRAEFVEAYQSGNHEKAAQLLNKESFSDHISTSPELEAEQSSTKDEKQAVGSEQDTKNAEDLSKKPFEIASTDDSKQLAGLSI